ncbi:MAG: RIP metalloprotease [Actinomycetota bacterium]|nr:RIP metalloprotease [Actinomycetota bacterium]
MTMESPLEDKGTREAEAPAERGTEPVTDLAQTRGQVWRNTARGALVIAVIAAASLYLNIGKTLLVVLALVVMIMVHELGHFAVAKWSKMKVTEYFLGFGPRIWSFRRGETEYGIKALPAGGYVKIVGMSSLEEVAPEDEPRAYRNASYPRRLAVSAAGSFMHFVMAYLILVVLFSVVGVADSTRAQVVALSKFPGVTSPAQAAGLKAGDVIYSVNGVRLTNVNTLISKIESSAAKPVELGVQRNGRDLNVQVVPVKASTLEHSLTGSAANKGLIGVELGEPLATASIGTSLLRPFSVIGQYTSATVGALVSHFSPSGISKYVHALQNPASTTSGAGASVRFESPVGIVRLASQAANVGLGAVLMLLFMINIFIGVFNMVPLLPLDGGHVLIATYERIRSRKGKPYHADMAKMLPVTYAVLMVIVLLGVTALYLDLTHPLANPFG